MKGAPEVPHHDLDSDGVAAFPGHCSIRILSLFRCPLHYPNGVLTNYASSGAGCIAFALDHMAYAHGLVSFAAPRLWWAEAALWGGCSRGFRGTEVTSPTRPTVPSAKADPTGLLASLK